MTAIRKLARFFGTVLDADDRKVLAQAFILIAALFLVLVACAAAVALAWNVFQFMTGV